MPVRRHRGLVGLLLVLATVAAILGAGARWLDVDVLDTANWTRTSQSLIANRSVRRAVSGFAVSRAFGTAGIDSALSRTLPADVAGDAQRDLRRAASRSTGSLLASANGRAAWRDANDQAVAGLLGAAAHPDRQRGVSLQLTPVLSAMLAGVAGEPLVRAIPGASSLLTLRDPDAGRLQLLDAGEVRAAAPVIRGIRILGWALPLASLLALLGSLALASGWRARCLSRCGYALLIAGAVVLGLRALAQYALSAASVTSSVDRAAVRAAWLIASVGLRTDGLFLAVAGAIIAVGSWLVRLILR